ncbi:hypothetical protein [Pseudomonas silesiensis]|jgi:hypothetical protein|uniref:hypothetical protein n=1 Tax=Pseudomonas silesiensis TaxID=1853130 RepID=UPI0034D4D7D0
MHGVIRAACYSLMTMFVSCGVGAQDPDTQSSTGFTATPEEARGTFHGGLRLYLPKPQIASSQWKMPLSTPVNQQQ